MPRTSPPPTSPLSQRVHSYALTHDGNRLFGLVMGALVVAWIFTAIASTGGLCTDQRQADLQRAAPDQIAGQPAIPTGSRMAPRRS